MAEKTKETQQASHCTGDCRRCLPIQRAYCSSQIAYNNMKILEALSHEIQALGEKVEAITNTEGMLFNPSEQNLTEREENATVSVEKE